MRGVHLQDWILAGLIGGVTGIARIVVDQGSAIPEAWVKQIGDAGPWAIFAFVLAVYALWERRTTLEKLISGLEALQSANATAIQGVRDDMSKQAAHTANLLEKALDRRS